VLVDVDHGSLWSQTYCDIHQNHLLIFSDFSGFKSDVPYPPLTSLAPVILSHPRQPLVYSSSHHGIHLPIPSALQAAIRPHPRTVNQEPATTSLSILHSNLYHEQPWTSSGRWWAATTIARPNCTTSEGPARQESRTCIRSNKGQMDIRHR
jgi:hypothetical protein